MSFQAYLDNIHAKIGKRPADFFAAARKSGIAGPDLTAGALVAWLKKDFGLGHGHAMAIWAVFKKNGWTAGPRRKVPQGRGEGNMTNAALPPAAGARCLPAAQVAAGSAVAVALIVVALHVIRPELEPSWRFISEYAIGGLGWIMKLAFLIWAAGCLALALALWREVTAWPGKLGVVVLWLVAIALVPAGLFAMDPVTARPEEATTSGMIHAISSMIGVPGVPIAAMLISSSLWRTNSAWARHRFAIMTTAHATWVSFVAMNIYVVWALSTSGGFNPEHMSGWLNRLVVAAYLAWQLTVGWLLVMKRREAMNGPA